MTSLTRVNKPLALLLLALITLLTPAKAGEPGKSAEAGLRKFLISTKGTYGWQPAQGDISYDFFRDGRLAVQGPDGEATMWEGKWSLKGDQLTMSYTNNDGKLIKSTVTVQIDGEDLLLSASRYTRYRAQ